MISNEGVVGESFLTALDSELNFYFFDPWGNAKTVECGECGKRICCRNDCVIRCVGWLFFEGDSFGKDWHGLGLRELYGEVVRDNAPIDEGVFASFVVADGEDGVFFFE